MRNFKNRLVLTLFVFSFLFASATETRTNSHLGSLRGRVTDASSQILPGATIIVEELNTGVTTDVNGFYSLELPAGTYTLNVSYVGFESKKVNITVDNAKTQEENISLSEGVELKEVEIVGALAGQRRALQMQKSSIGVVNVVSAEQTGKFPDTNIGDALKRISGINVQYDQGEARFGQVRGTSSDLMSVSVNGNRLPSAEGDTRNVQLDLIPTDMIQTIEVNKVVTSDMDGDAIGGAVNLVTKSSPSRRVANFTIGTGHYPVSGKPQLNLGATLGNRFFGKKLGVIASASYQYMPGGSDNTEFEYVEQDGELQLKEVQVRQYYVIRERQSYSLSLDYKFNPDHKIAFKALYNLRNDWENRYRISYKKLNESAKKQSVEIQTKGGSSSNDNARLERQQTMDFSFDGTHHFGKLSADWNLSYSRATEERPEERYVAYSSKGTDYGSAFADVFLRQPYCTLPIPSVTDSSWSIDELTNSNQDIEENEYKTRVNFSLPLAAGLYGNKLSFGAKYVLKDKSRVTDFYEYEDYILGDWRSSVTSEIRNGFMPGSRYPIGTQFISKHLLGSLDLSNAQGTEVLEEEAGNYDARERIVSGYLRFDQSVGKRLDAVLGLRLEHTSLKTSGVNYEQGERNVYDADGSLAVDDEGNAVTEEYETLSPTGRFTNNYLNLLPSLLLKYNVSDNLSLRASFTTTLSRPKYSALIANKSFNLNDNEAVIGNPETKPTRSLNYDISAEYIFGGTGLLSLGLFHKDVSDVNVETLGYYTGEELGLAGSAETFEVTQCLNAYDAKVFGAEVAFQSDFGFISPALRCLAFYGNYTYTHSSTRNYNPHLGIQPGDDVRMAGSPEHTANASLCFEKSGFSARVSYNFASSFIDQMNLGSRNLDRYYDKVGYLDLNASYTWGKRSKLTVYAEAGNLLNQPLRYYQGSSERTMQVEYYGVRINAGLKISL